MSTKKNFWIGLPMQMMYDQSQGYGGFSLVAHNANPLEVKILCQLRKTFG